MSAAVGVIDRCERCGEFVPYHKRYSVRFKQVVTSRGRAYMLCHDCYEAVMRAAKEEIGDRDD